MINTFSAGQYIVTRDGFRGYVVKRLEALKRTYEIRLASGLTVKDESDLSLDDLMYQEDF